MAKYHINYKGEPGVCSATISCPFGGEEDHFTSAEAAREAYEVAMSNHHSLAGKKVSGGEAERTAKVARFAKQDLMGDWQSEPGSENHNYIAFTSATYGRLTYSESASWEAEAVNGEYLGRFNSLDEATKALEKADTTEKFENIKDELIGEIKKLEQLALGRHNKALDSLTDAREGKPSRSWRGGRYGANPRDMIEMLTKAKREIGLKGNDYAYKSITKLLERLEATKEIKSDAYYQGNKAMKTTKLPAGSKRVFDKRWERTTIRLADGTTIDWSVVQGKPYYYTTDSREYMRRSSFDLGELAAGKGKSSREFQREVESQG